MNKRKQKNDEKEEREEGKEEEHDANQRSKKMLLTAFAMATGRNRLSAEPWLGGDNCLG